MEDGLVINFHISNGKERFHFNIDNEKERLFIQLIAMKPQHVLSGNLSKNKMDFY